MRARATSCISIRAGETGSLRKGKNMFVKKMALCGAALLSLTAAPAMAGTADGKFQVKVMGTAVLPDGKISDLKVNAAGLPAGTQSAANDNVVPTLAVEYFLSPNFSVETICCLTQHDVDGAGALAGTELVANVKILPATVTAKFHFPIGGVKPYIGAGPTYFIFIGEKSGATTKTLGLPRMQLDDKVGAVVQAGFDIPVNDKGFGISLDAKRYFVRPQGHWYNAAGTEMVGTRHKLDPWVLSAGVSYRF